MRRWTSAAALALALLAYDRTATSAPPAETPRPGLYSGRAPEHPGLIQVELYADQTAIIRRVITIHLPPAETETLRTKLDAGCFEPTPRSLARCLVATSSASITVTSAQSGKAVRLPWTAKLDGRTAPEARARSR